jgi:hypothetical protein
VPPDALQAPRQVGRHARRAEVVGDYPAHAPLADTIPRRPPVVERDALEGRPRAVAGGVNAQRVGRGGQALRLSKSGDE